VGGYQPERRGQAEHQGAEEHVGQRARRRSVLVVGDVGGQEARQGDQRKSTGRQQDPYVQRAHLRPHQPERHAGLQGSGQRAVRNGVPHPVGRWHGRTTASNRVGQRRRGDQHPEHAHQHRDQRKAQP